MNWFRVPQAAWLMGLGLAQMRVCLAIEQIAQLGTGEASDGELAAVTGLSRQSVFRARSSLLKAGRIQGETACGKAGRYTSTMPRGGR